MYKYQLQAIYQISDLSDVIILLLLASLATQSLVFLLRESRIFSFLRHKYSPFKYLLTCGYCLSFYVSFFIVSPFIVLGIFSFSYSDVVAYLLVWLCIQRLSNVIHDLSKLLYFGRVQHINIIKSSKEYDEQG